MSFSVRAKCRCTRVLSRSCVRRIKGPRVPYYIGSFILPGSMMMATVQVASMGQHLMNRSLLVIPIRCPVPIKKKCSD